jgi:hypothetical protein
VAKINRWWQPVAFAVVLIAVVVTALYFYLRPRYDTADKLVSLLPRSDAAVFYADIRTLRTAGILRSLEGAKGTQEPDYLRFVSETGFAYDRDLDAIAIASVPNQLFGVLRGRFDWPRLGQYATRNAGSCHNAYCQVPASKSGRWISFFPIRANVMGIAVSSDPSAAYALLPRRGAPVLASPDYPAWVQLPQRILAKPDVLPPALQVFSRALSSASEVTLAIDGAGQESGGGPFVIRLFAGCDSEARANAVREHLSQLTGMLGRLESRGVKTSEPGVGTLLASGTFRTVNRQVEGAWRVPAALIDSLLH